MGVLYDSTVLWQCTHVQNVLSNLSFSEIEKAGSAVYTVYTHSILQPLHFLSLPEDGGPEATSRSPPHPLLPTASSQLSSSLSLCQPAGVAPSGLF
jgi:hypothetical protein